MENYHLLILTEALDLLAESYTNKGYKFKSNLTGRISLDALGALDQAYKNFNIKKSHACPLELLLQNTSIRLYGYSFITVNDDLGYKAIIHVFTSAIKELSRRVVDFSTSYTRYGPKTLRRPSQEHPSRTSPSSD